MDVSDVGPLPVLPAPKPGEVLSLNLSGMPPEKTTGRSMRNAASPQRVKFMLLRDAAIAAMGGRKWYEGAVAIELKYRAPSPAPVLQQRFLDGVMDTLGGSHGPSFIYLPIVYLDDCQVAQATVMAEVGAVPVYEVHVEFL
jgi:hypothetical protein